MARLHATTDRPEDAGAPPALAGKARQSRFVFASERGAAIRSRLFPHGRAYGIKADLGIKAHAHMLRHACGFKLANGGVDTRSLQAYLGHSNIQNSARYIALASDRFKGFWRD
jgi:site-specific recombinase XerD